MLYSAAVLIFIGVVFPVGGTVFNYFTKPTQRYTFVLIPFFLMAMAWMWDYLRKGGKALSDFNTGGNSSYGLGISGRLETDRLCRI